MRRFSSGSTAYYIFVFIIIFLVLYFLGFVFIIIKGVLFVLFKFWPAFLILGIIWYIYKKFRKDKKGETVYRVDNGNDDKTVEIDDYKRQ